jgi:hypothetical protein
MPKPSATSRPSGAGPKEVSRWGGRACAHEIDRIAGKGPILQPALAHEIGEPAVCGQRYLVACLLQPLPQARERRNITSRTRCQDENPHQVSPVLPLRSSALPPLTCTPPNPLNRTGHAAGR